MAADILLSIFFIARRDDLIINGVLRITLSVSEGTGFRRNRPLADAQGYSPLRNATNGLRLGAIRGANLGFSRVSGGLLLVSEIPALQHKIHFSGRTRSRLERPLHGRKPHPVP